MIRVFILFFAASILFSCEKDDNKQEKLNSEQSRLQSHVVKLQQSGYDLMMELEGEMDSLAIIDSLISFVSSDTAVEWVQDNGQGIVIQYKSGIKGGILINPLRDTGYVDVIYVEVLLGQNDAENRLKATAPPRLPANNKVLYISPAYHEFKNNEDFLLGKIGKALKRTEFKPPEKILDEAATLERFVQLDDYGIVFISSHGLAWPEMNKITEVYLMTGEVVNEYTSKAYWDEIITGSVPLIFRNGTNYFVSPAFLSWYNNFEDDTALVWGGFCFSGRGTWKQEVLNAGAAGYMGYSWAVVDLAQTNWIWAFTSQLSDTLRFSPMTCAEWMLDRKLEKSYYSEEYNRRVYLEYEGLPELALVDKYFTYPYNYATIRAKVNVTCRYKDGSTEYFGPVIIGGTSVIRGETADSVFTASWNNSSTRGEMKVTIKGNPPVLKGFNYSRTTYEFDTYQEGLEAVNINLVGQKRPGGGMLYYVTGTPVCGLLTTVQDKVDGGGGDYSREVISFTCDANSYLEIVLDTE